MRPVRVETAPPWGIAFARFPTSVLPEPLRRREPGYQLAREEGAVARGGAPEDVVRALVARVAQIEARAPDARARTVHEREGAALAHRIDDADVGEAVVALAVAVSVVGLAEEDDVAGLGLAAVERACPPIGPEEDGDAAVSG